MDKTQKFLDDFKVQLPLIGLPGLGWQTPELTATISNAGGLGVLTIGLMTESEIEAAVAKIRSLTDKPFGVMLFAPKEALLDNQKLRLQNASLSPLREDLGLATPLGPIILPNFDDQFRKVVELQVPAVGVRLGGLREPYMEELEDKKIPVFGLASNQRDAKVLVSSGVQAVVACGWGESGLLSYEEVPAKKAGVDSVVLWDECARSLAVPVLGAGSVMTEAQVKAAKAFGLAGLMLSDAFVNSKESPLREDWKIKIGYTTDASSEMAATYLGRPSRFLANGFSDTIVENGLPVLSFPYQYFALKDIFDKAAELGRIDLAFLEIGQQAYLASRASAADIIQQFNNLWSQA